MNFPQTLSLIFLLAIVSTAGAQDVAPKRGANPTIDSKMVAAGFLDSHPDLRWRTWALDDFGEGKYESAFGKFKRAAWYSDKPSQAIVGEMLWAGVGTPQDRGLAYVWMAIAAERNYRSFVAKRDMYWNLLNNSERDRAIEAGPALRADYADTIAERRLAIILERERRQLTGSRLGSITSNVQISVPGVGTIDAAQYYSPQFWDPKQYRQWQDAIWTDLRIGQVTASGLQAVSTDEENKASDGAERQLESDKEPDKTRP